MVTRVEIRPGFWIEVNPKAMERAKVGRVVKMQVSAKERRRILADIVAHPRTNANAILLDEGVRLSRLYGMGEAARRIGVTMSTLAVYKAEQIRAGLVQENERVERPRMMANLWWEQTGQLSAQQPAAFTRRRKPRKSKASPSAQPCAPQAPKQGGRPWDNIAKRREDSGDNG